MTDTARYLTDLDAELARAGVRGGRRERIVADHFGCDQDADLDVGLVAISRQPPRSSGRLGFARRRAGRRATCSSTSGHSGPPQPTSPAAR